MKKTLMVQAAAVIGSALFAFSVRADTRKLQAAPSAYNPGNAPVQITATWTSDVQPTDGPSDHPLILKISDTVPFPPGAAATAAVMPVEDLRVTHLAFDHRIGTHCTNGSPRWDVETTDGSVYAFGCASGVRQVDLPAAGWERITFSCTDVQVLKGTHGSCPLGSIQTVARLQIVHDEAGSTTLDNLDVNWVVMSGPASRK